MQLYPRRGVAETPFEISRAEIACSKWIEHSEGLYEFQHLQSMYLESASSLMWRAFDYYSATSYTPSNFNHLIPPTGFGIASNSYDDSKNQNMRMPLKLTLR